MQHLLRSEHHGCKAGARQKGAEGNIAALTQAAKDKLRQTVAKIEKLEEEKKEVGGQIKDVYQEAKSMGYDTKALRTVIRLRTPEALAQWRKANNLG